MGRKDSEVCSLALKSFSEVCLKFGVPLAKDKTVHRSTCLQYFGIEIDTVKSEFRLPMSKIRKVRSLLSVLLHSSKVMVTFIRTVLGLLAFTARVMPMDRILCHRSAMQVSGLRNPKLHISIHGYEGGFWRLVGLYGML